MAIVVVLVGVGAALAVLIKSAFPGIGGFAVAIATILASGWIGYRESHHRSDHDDHQRRRREWVLTRRS